MSFKQDESDSLWELTQRLKASDKLTYVNDCFKPELDSRWTHKSDRVLSEFHLIDMGQGYLESELPVAVRRESKRRGEILRLAAVRELMLYIGHGWNGVDWVVAFGSTLTSPAGSLYSPCIWGDGENRKLSLGRTSDPWTGWNLVLCVIV